MEAIQEHIDHLEDTIDDLKDENQTLRRELSLSSPRNVEALIYSVNEYLDWVDSPNQTMSENVIGLIQTQLRTAVDEALMEMK